MIDRSAVMKRGAFAMMDILGFKGIWRRHRAETVLARMRAIETLIAGSVDYAIPGFMGISLLRAYAYVSALKVDLAFLSDTIVVGLSHPDCDDLALQAAVQVMGKIATMINEEAAVGEPSFALRGAISAGEFLIDGTYILGEAVDDAAVHMNLADAALTWTTPTAAGYLAQIPLKNLAYFFVEHDVPLRDGRSVRTMVARPYECWMIDEERKKEVRRRLLSSFGRSLDVEIKRQNTEIFVARAEGTLPLQRYLLPALFRRGTSICGGLRDHWSNGAEEIPIGVVPEGHELDDDHD